MSQFLQRVYYRNGADYRNGDDVSFADIQRRYDFYSIRVGRWVTSVEQQRAANLFYDALRDMESLLRVPPEVISLNGTLALHFAVGGRKHSAAHYEPASRALALAKNAGGGSLAHEWFHAFDHYICAHMFATHSKVPAQAFASRYWLSHHDFKVHPLNNLLDTAFKLLFLDSNGQGVSPFMRHCMAIDKRLGRVYFSQPEEIAARAFERMLQGLGQKNHFLVSGTLQSETANAGLYPDPSTTFQLGELWLSYFYHLGRALSAKRCSS
ncbi:hypothetical protein CWE12_10310 [Aliidiomarina sedimenti]|uniref:Large polyvalent protein-associated domain-containing protein n=1 Tax=Aliidiomarina sedimenti TaxID=1933879 RepID=A0ABY0BYE1_9GAMM|nr:CLCA_X family protein [Aliidiomarina sedimenti]RUO29363.1 hypothetical protein CWE12_10310 [Aliidiomarina sedimenti]